jgi:peptidoglycan hydrolase-like protein with peptidoglycan-binding domain
LAATEVPTTVPSAGETEVEASTGGTADASASQAESSSGEASETGAAAEKAATGESTSQTSEVDAVKQLQSALKLPVDGEFGPETEAAVRRLQARHGLAVDGIVGPATWNLIGVQVQVELTPPASALPAAPAGKQGAPATSAPAQTPAGTPGQPVAPATGATAVEWLQRALKLPVDGEFGPETEAAVRRLQARHGLAVDGVVGPSTWAVIGVPAAATLTPPPSALVAPSSGGAPGAGPGAPGAGGGEAESVVARVIAAADEIATRPYVWGGGHGSFESEGYDCSGSVSYALHGGGLLSSPEDSTGLESYGEPGPGRYITIYANAEHAYMVIDGKRFDTVALAEDGSRWGGSSDDGGGFVERHPDGL